MPAFPPVTKIFFIATTLRRVLRLQAEGSVVVRWKPWKRSRLEPIAPYQVAIYRERYLHGKRGLRGMYRVYE